MQSTIFIQTVSMRAHTRVRDVCGYSEVWKPQVLYIRFSESLLYRLVKIFPGEHRSHRISQVHDLPPPLRHFLPADRYNSLTYEYFLLLRQEINLDKISILGCRDLKRKLIIILQIYVLYFKKFIMVRESIGIAKSIVSP